MAPLQLGEFSIHDSIFHITCYDHNDYHIHYKSHATDQQEYIYYIVIWQLHVWVCFKLRTDHHHLYLCYRIFGFVARKTGTGQDNVCHLFAEHDPEQPASAIVNFVSKVMIGSQKNN